MQRFRFRLDRVLRLRERAEQSARLAFAEQLARLQALEQRRADVRAAWRYAQDEAASSARSAGLAAAYARNLELEDKKLGLEVSRCSAQLGRLREIWIQARSELRQLERLRELRFTEHREQSARTEQAELEELAALRDRGRRQNEEAWR